MEEDLSCREARCLKSCKEHRMLPNSVALMSVHKAVNQKCTVEVTLDRLENHDVSQIIDVFRDVRCGAIDIVCESSCSLDRDSMLLLMNEANSKLRVVDLQHASLGKDILSDILQVDLQCQVLKLRFNEFTTLNFPGKFMLLHTLNLDLCSSLTTLEDDSFASMPNLMHLSLCGTKIANLWTTSAALSRLKSLVELRFQSCQCCKTTALCPSLKGERRDPKSRLPDEFSSSSFPGINFSDRSSNVQTASIVFNKLQIEVCHGKLEIQESESPTSVLDLVVEDSPVSVASEMSILRNPSPICFENHYREYMITSLPGLQVLDNLPIQQEHREIAKTVFSNHFERLPYKKNLANLLQMREKGLSSRRKSKHFYSRGVCAAKVGTNPVLSRVSEADSGRRLRPRQFEYHPSVSHLMGFGTLDGEVVTINHEKGRMVNYIPPSRTNSSAIALCWLSKHPSKILVGFDNGFLRLHDINEETTSNTTTYDDFNQLTSVHVNATDEKFLASGYSRKLAIYDVCTGRRLYMFTDIHQEAINVSKFAHHSPHLLVTSSYDRDVKMWDIRQNPTKPCYTASSARGNVMVCFSPDDLYLLVSAVDNEVKQLLAADGRLHTRFDISPTGSSHNFTRTYYMNGRDYIISGSSDESLVRICCGQTGRRLRDIELEDRKLGSSIFVQSLRGDPFRPFHMSVLAAYDRPSSTPWDIVRVNLLA